MGIALTLKEDPQPPFPIYRKFHQDNVGSAPGTFFPIWGGFGTASHVMREFKEVVPEFITAPPLDLAPAVDACLFGCTLPIQQPPEPEVGREVLVFGVPFASRVVSVRKARVLLERNDTGSSGFAEKSWIAKMGEAPTWHPPLEPDMDFDLGNYHEPVGRGMSGGPVVYTDGEPIGICVTQNSPYDSNNDGGLEQSLDFYALSDIWRIARQFSNIA